MKTAVSKPALSLNIYVIDVMTVVVLVHGQFFARNYCLNSLCALFRYSTCADDYKVGCVIWTVVLKNFLY